MNRITSKYHSLIGRLRKTYGALKANLPWLRRIGARPSNLEAYLLPFQPLPLPKEFPPRTSILPKWRQPRRIQSALQSLKVAFSRVGIRRIILAVVAVFMLTTGLSLFLTFRALPDLNTLPDRLNQPSIRITDRNGRLLYDFLPENGGRNTVLPLDQIPDCIKSATIAVEDRNFYTNPGVDLEGILRAAWIDLRGGEAVAGGSTITQQVVRNFLMSKQEQSERSLGRKLRETVLAWEMTKRYSKDEILGLYLNQTYYGGLAYGVEAAAQTYFGKPAVELALPECALLAGLPQAPGQYNPFTRPDLALQRRSIVLGLMQKAGFISETNRNAADAAPLLLNPSPYPFLAPHFLWMVKDRLDALITAGTIDPRQSLIVRTTLDLDQQQLAEQAIARQLAVFRENPADLNRNINNAALVDLDPHSGQILALVGSAGYFQNDISGAINMALAPRQPGSAFKPFLYAQALDPQRVHPWTAATVLLDVSTTFLNNDNQPYTPVDYDLHEHGPVSVRTALASSLNIPAVLTLREVGIDNTISLARRLGIDTLDDPRKYDLSLALGGGQLSLLALTTAYGALADGGVAISNTCLLDIRDAGGNLVYQEPKAKQVQVFDPRVAWLLSDILSDDRARSLGFGRNSTLKLDRTAAVKTGTTTNFHDNWTIGYTPDIVAGVWVGNSDNEAMRDITGLTGAAPIWQDFMLAVLQGKPDKPFPRPDGLTQREVCTLSGLLPTPACTDTRLEWFISGTQPTQLDGTYQQVVVDSLTGRLADSSTPSDRRQLLTVFNLPLLVRAWARAQGWPLLSDLTTGGDSVLTSGSSLLLVSPEPNSEYRIDNRFDPSAQQILVQAVAGPDVVQVTLWVDNQELASFSGPPFQAWWPLALGQHSFHAEGRTTDGSWITTPLVQITVHPESG
jgi:penicillin-binding protein 1C